jgi:signal transduction histidine kinase
MSAASWRRAVDRATMVCVGFVLTVQTVVCCSALGSSWGAWPDTDLLRVMVVAGCDVALLAGCVVVVRHPDLIGGPALGLSAAATGIVALVAACGIAAPSPLPESALQIVPVNSVQTIQFAVVGFGLAFRRGALVILASGPLYVALRGVAVGSTAFEALDEWALPAVSSLAVLAFLDHLRSGADTADQLAAAAHDAARSSASRSNAEIAREEARRVVHDDVISALRAAELELGADQVRHASQDALTSLAGRGRLSTLEELTNDLQHAAPLDVVVEATAWTEPPPPRVLTTLRAAAAEALRNAVRHGGARRVVVRLRSSGVDTEVVITDDGSGLPADWQMGFGVRESILGRLAEVGGQAELAPAAGGGAEVRLRWPAAVPTSARTAIPVVADRSRAARAVGAACVAGTIYPSLRFPGESPALGLAVAAAILLAIAVAVDRVSRSSVLDAPVTTRGLALGTLILCGLLWAGLTAAGDGALLSIHSWVVGCTANVVALLAFDVTVRRIAPTVVALVLSVILYAAHDPTVRVTEPLGAIATPIVVVGMAALLGAALRHGERLVAAARAELAVQTEAEAWERTGVEARRRYLEHLKDDVVPYLAHAAATGETDPEVARLLSARCRDDLYLATPLDAMTRRAVHAARQRGVTVTLRPGHHDPAVAWPALREVLGAARPDSLVTVLPVNGMEAGRIVVVPGLPSDSVDLAGHHERVRSTFTLSSEPTTSGEPVGATG